MQILNVPDWLDSLPVLLGLGIIVIDFGLRFAVLGIIPGNRKPSSAMAWLLLILLTPLLGIAVFLLLGSSKLGKARHAKQVEINARIDALQSNVMAG